jgi:hypothetical protein
VLRLEVQRRIGLQGAAKRTEVGGRLQHHRNSVVGVAVEGGHEGIDVGVHDTLQCLSLVKVADDDPVGAANRAPVTDFEPGELAAAGVAGDKLMEPWPKHSTLGKANFRSVLGKVRGGAHERKEDSDSRHTPVGFDGDQRIEHHDRRAVHTFFYSGKVANADRFVFGDAALNPARAGAAENHAVGAHIPCGLALHANAHSQHGDEHTNGAGHAHNDGQDGPHSLCRPR